MPSAPATPSSANARYLSSSHCNMSPSAPFPDLLSPIQLDSPPHPALTVINHSPSSNRSNAANCRIDFIQDPSPRHNGQHDGTFKWCSSATFFDQLPWISILETPDQSGVHDIADLSQLDKRLLSRPSPNTPRVGAGPVRSRKSSTRSSPRHAAPANIFDDLPSWFLPSAPCSDPRTYSPRTPRNLRTSSTPSRVRFHNLLPVFSPARLKCEFDRYQFAMSD